MRELGNSKVQSQTAICSTFPVRKKASESDVVVFLSEISKQITKLVNHFNN